MEDYILDKTVRVMDDTYGKEKSLELKQEGMCVTVIYGKRGEKDQEIVDLPIGLLVKAVKELHG